MIPCEWLPRAGAKPAHLEARTTTPIAQRHTVTVLVADDDPDFQALVADLLVSEGYTAMQTWNGADVHRLASEHQPDAIVLDLLLPRMSGLEVIEKLRQDSATRAIPIIVVSASARLMLESEMRRADAVIQKPFDLGTLLQALEDVGRKRSSATTQRPPARLLLAPH